MEDNPMSDKETPEAELTNDEGPGTTSEISEAFNTVVNETVKLVSTLGKTLVEAAEDASNLMVVKVDADTRAHLDLMVNVGIAKNRCKAASLLIQEGITAESATFAKIQQTHKRITELQQQMRSLVKARA
jgi:hypothetical protein